MSFKTRSAHSLHYRATAILGLIAILTLASTHTLADTGTCNGQSLTLPFTDVSASNIFFCSIAQAFFTGLTNGTTPTTYSPTDPVPREQMAAFITRTQDSALRRGSRRAFAGQWATIQQSGLLKATTVGTTPAFNCFDGEDIWVANFDGQSVTRVHASDGRVLGTWTGAIGAVNTIAAAGSIYVTGSTTPGRIYRIDPSQAPGAVILVEDNLGTFPVSVAFDGSNLWTANEGLAFGQGSITRYNILTDIETTFEDVFNEPGGIVFDGTHLWVVDFAADALYRVNPANGAILEMLAMGTINGTAIPVFDGSNIWVPVSNAVQVVSTSTPARLLATLTGNGLGNTNRAAAFDGERIMVCNDSGTSLSLWKASSLTPLGNLNLGGGRNPQGVCSDGLHFWITVTSPGINLLLRF
jgi:hypothetical protein